MGHASIGAGGFIIRGGAVVVDSGGGTAVSKKWSNRSSSLGSSPSLLRSLKSPNAAAKSVAGLPV